MPAANEVPDPATPSVPEGRGTRPVDPRDAGRRVMPRHLGRRHRPLVIVLVALAAVLVMTGGWHAWRALREAYLAGTRGTGVELRLSVPGYGEGSSPVPIRVEGTTAGGARVAGVRLVSQTDSLLTLAPGSYTVTAVGSPVTSGGAIYQVPEGSWSVEVTGDGAEVTGPDGTPSDAVTMSFAPIASQQVTEEELDGIRDWMVDEGVQGVDGYISTVRNGGA